MKRVFFLLTWMTVLSSVSLFAQDQRSDLNYDEEILRYEGQWPKGRGILYSSKDGLIIGTFDNGVPVGKCVCYLPTGEVYWGDYKKGKATGKGRLYRDNGIVMSGDFKNGKYHGIDTLFRKDGSIYIGKFRKGKLKAKMFETKIPFVEIPKPKYPRVDLQPRQEEFLKALEIRQEARHLMLIESMGFITPRFQGGSLEDFTLWVNSQVEVPESFDPTRGSRAVLVEFTVMPDGTLADIHAIFGSNPDLNEAAEKAVAKSPVWEPGTFDGEKKSTRLTVPVVFEGE